MWNIITNISVTVFFSLLISFCVFYPIYVYMHVCMSSYMARRKSNLSLFQLSWKYYFHKNAIKKLNQTDIFKKEKEVYFKLVKLNCGGFWKVLNERKFTMSYRYFTGVPHCQYKSLPSPLFFLDKAVINFLDNLHS